MTDHGANFIMALALVLGCLYGVYASDWQGPEASGPHIVGYSVGRE